MKFYRENGTAPETFKVSQITEKDLPLFAKPDIGQGSQGNNANRKNGRFKLT